MDFEIFCSAVIPSEGLTLDVSRALPPRAYPRKMCVFRQGGVNFSQKQRLLAIFQTTFCDKNCWRLDIIIKALK